MFMKRIAIYALMLLVALIVSCGRHRLVVHGFVDEPQDSILFDLKDYVLPASEVDLWNVMKYDGYYYFCFHEQMRGKWGGSHSFLMGASEDKLHARYIPLPDNVNTLNNAINLTEAEFRSRNINYNENPVDRWCFSNACLKLNDQRQALVIKPNNEKKIDGAVTLVSLFELYRRHKSELRGLAERAKPTGGQN